MAYQTIPIGQLSNINDEYDQITDITIELAVPDMNLAVPWTDIEAAGFLTPSDLIIFHAMRIAAVADLISRGKYDPNVVTDPITLDMLHEDGPEIFSDGNHRIRAMRYLLSIGQIGPDFGVQLLDKRARNNAEVCCFN